jgi:hypothetical protein
LPPEDLAAATSPFANAQLRPTKYLSFRLVPSRPGAKTGRWEVVSQSSGVVLGTIKWYGAWRQYCFFPEGQTLYNVDCLVAVADRVETCNRWQRNIRANAS